MDGFMGEFDEFIGGFFVVWIGEDGVFMDDPEYFESRADAIEYRKEKRLKYPDRDYVLFRYDEVHCEE